MKVKQISRASLLAMGAFLAISAKADTTYDMTFTDTTASPTFSNATGTFTINSADQITSFDVTFKVLKAYSFENASGSPGDMLTFKTITAVAPGPIATYSPVTGYFGSAYNNYFYLDEEQAGHPDNGARLTIDGGQNVNGPAYDIDPLSNGEFFTPLDTGTWSVAPAAVTPPTGAPEPTSAALLLAGLAVSAFVRRRKKPSPN
jgi:hypothetical protein